MNDSNKTETTDVTLTVEVTVYDHHSDIDTTEVIKRAVNSVENGQGEVVDFEISDSDPSRTRCELCTLDRDGEYIDEKGRTLCTDHANFVESGEWDGEPIEVGEL